MILHLYSPDQVNMAFDRVLNKWYPCILIIVRTEIQMKIPTAVITYKTITILMKCTPYQKQRVNGFASKDIVSFKAKGSNCVYKLLVVRPFSFLTDDIMVLKAAQQFFLLHSSIIIIIKLSS